MTRNRCLTLLVSLCLLLPAAGCAQTGANYGMDFAYLHTLAPNAVAWLYQPGTDINQPVVYSQDEDYYLRHRYDNAYSGNGAIFITGETPPDMTAQVITLRGNNCMDYSLFGTLSEYREPEYYQQYPTLYLITPEGSYRLDVFAGLRTRHRDTETWVVAEGDDLMGERLSAILENSFLTPTPESLPEEGDQWVVMTTESTDGSGNRYVIYARKRPLPASDEPVTYINQLEMDSRETQSGYAGAADVGEWMIYGQNDPLWRRLTFEVANSSRRRPFGDGGCGPTSIAMAIANLVPKEELPKLRDYALEPQGYVFCSCCIGNDHCNEEHVPYQLTTPDEFLRYFPLAVAEFAMGNNTLDVQGRRDSFGTNMSYLEALCSVYGISVTSTKSLDEAAAFLRQENTIAITCASGYANPFTKTSHFLVLVRATDEHLYVLDPLRRESYEELDRYGVLEMITPGLVRVRLEDAHMCHFSPIYLLSYQGSPDGLK